MDPVCKGEGNRAEHVGGRGRGRKLGPHALQAGVANLGKRPLGKTVWQFLKKRNIYLALDPVVPLCGTYPKEEKLYVQTRTMRNNDSNWIISPNWKQHKYGSTGEFIHVMSQIR